MEKKRGRGRPPLPPSKGKRHSLHMRTTKEIRELLDAAAYASGRSLAHEIEYRLERSFDVDRMADFLKNLSCLKEKKD